MRRLLLTTAMLSLSIHGQSFAAPAFHSLDPSMAVNQTTPAAAPLAAPVVAAKPSVARDGEIIDSVGGDAIPALPLEAVKENGVSYISGGIGDEEVAQLKSQEGLYNLRVEISGQSGEYLADLSMVLKDGKGTTIVTIADAGPYVYLQVPVGSYSIDVASTGGSKQTVSVKVPAGGAVKAEVKL